VQSREEEEFLTIVPNLQTRQYQAQVKLGVAEEDERCMAEWRHLHPEDVAREEAFWAAKKETRREMRRLRRERKRFLEAELDNPNLTLDIKENSSEWMNSCALPRRASRRGAAATSSLV
jgi:hypothetical protein